MKTKTLFLSLFAGAFLCFSNASYAQYHSSSGGSGGGGAFAQGGYDINVGVGFIGSGLGNIAGSGLSNVSVGPAYEFSIERALTDHISFGIGLAYQSASSSLSVPDQGYVYDPSTFSYNVVNYTSTDKYTVSLFNVTFRGAYHFTAGDKLDPYLGIQLGYCDATETDAYTTNDPNSASSTQSAGITGIEYGLYGGARYFFSDHVGAWLELQYAAASFTYLGYSASINAANIINLGVSFKW